jgi:hypothetical protein
MGICDSNVTGPCKPCWTFARPAQHSRPPLSPMVGEGVRTTSNRKLPFGHFRELRKLPLNKINDLQKRLYANGGFRLDVTTTPTLAVIRVRLRW